MRHAELLVLGVALAVPAAAQTPAPPKPRTVFIEKVGETGTGIFIPGGSPIVAGSPAGGYIPIISRPDAAWHNWIHWHCKK